MFKILRVMGAVSKDKPIKRPVDKVGSEASSADTSASEARDENELCAESSARLRVLTNCCMERLESWEALVDVCTAPSRLIPASPMESAHPMALLNLILPSVASRHRLVSRPIPFVPPWAPSGRLFPLDRALLALMILLLLAEILFLSTSQF